MKLLMLVILMTSVAVSSLGAQNSTEDEIILFRKGTWNILFTGEGHTFSRNGFGERTLHLDIGLGYFAADLWETGLLMSVDYDRYSYDYDENIESFDALNAGAYVNFHWKNTGILIPMINGELRSLDIFGGNFEFTSATQLYLGVGWKIRILDKAAFTTFIHYGKFLDSLPEAYYYVDYRIGLVYFIGNRTLEGKH